MLGSQKRHTTGEGEGSRHHKKMSGIMSEDPVTLARGLPGTAGNPIGLSFILFIQLSFG
jgi:hypothetical protein